MENWKSGLFWLNSVGFMDTTVLFKLEWGMPILNDQLTFSIYQVLSLYEKL